jgi:hypothetical protein
VSTGLNTMLTRYHVDSSEYHVDSSEYHINSHEYHVDPSEYHVDPSEYHVDSAIDSTKPYNEARFEVHTIPHTENILSTSVEEAAVGNTLLAIRNRIGNLESKMEFKLIKWHALMKSSFEYQLVPFII